MKPDLKKTQGRATKTYEDTDDGIIPLDPKGNLTFLQKESYSLYYMETKLLEIFTDEILMDHFEDDDPDDPMDRQTIRFQTMTKLRPRVRNTDLYKEFIDWCSYNKIDKEFLKFTK